MRSSPFKLHYFQEMQKQRPVELVNYIKLLQLGSFCPFNSSLTCIYCTQIIRLQLCRAANTPVPQVTQPTQGKNHFSCRAYSTAWMFFSHFCPRTFVSTVAISRSFKESKCEPSTPDASSQPLPTSNCFQFRELGMVCQSGDSNRFLF